MSRDRASKSTPETLAPRYVIAGDAPLLEPRAAHVSLPLEVTYLSAYEGMPAFWRDVLEV